MAETVTLPPIAILAGGLATRMYPRTQTIAKAMLDLNREPFIAHQLRLLEQKGLRNIVICAGKFSEQIMDYVGDGSSFGLQVQYSCDGELLLGTGGAIKKALPLLGEVFFILYGDSYLDINYRAVYHHFQQAKKPAQMTVFHNQGQWDKSNIFFEDDAIKLYDKHSNDPRLRYIDYGLGLIKSAVFDSYPNNQPFDLADVYKNLVVAHQMAGYKVTKRFYEIGSPSGLQELKEYLKTEASMTITPYTRQYLDEIHHVADALDGQEIDKMVEILANLGHAGGRIFFLGVGGGAGNATHAVNDFRKIAGIESYTPTDNVSELTARINDEGWEGVFEKYLEVSRLNHKDAVFIFSVGGGNLEKNISVNLVNALKCAQKVNAKILGIVGRDGGYTKQVADACVVIKTITHETVTAHAEAFQAVVWHLIVSHPKLKKNEMKWEEVDQVAVAV
jgi:D-sedoheptulose 7-phosphate isomerase